MDIGSEINQKFKSCIKKKLKESGTYIDDELPEYIMVMIANKRNEYQMKEDLSLFLGDGTDEFVTWLFVMLRRIQNATQVDDTTHSEQKSGNSTTESKQRRASGSKSIGAVKAQKHELIVSKDSHAKGNTGVGFEKAAEKETEEKTESQFKSSGEKVRTKSTRSSHEKRQKIRRSHSPANKKQEDSDDEVKQLEPLKKKSSTHFPVSKKPRADSDNEQDNNIEKAPQVSSSISVQKVRPSLPPSRQAPGLLIRKAMQEANLSVSSQLHSETQKEINLDKSLPEISIELSNDQKTIQFTREKKYKLMDSIDHSPRSQGEATRNDVEANDKLQNGKPCKLREQEKSQDDGIEVQVPENEFSDEESEVKRRPDTRIVISQIEAEGVSGKDLQISNEASGQKDDELSSNKGPKREIIGNGNKNLEEKDLTDDKQRRDKRKHKHRRERSSHRERRQSSPRFVVTLDGAHDLHPRSDKPRRKRSKRDFLPNDEDPLFIDLNPKAPLAMLESAQQEIDKMAHRLDLMQNVLPPNDVQKCTGYPSNNDRIVPVLPSIPAPLPTLLTTKPSHSNPLPFASGHFNPANIQINPFLQPHRFSSLVPVPSPVIVMQNASGTTRGSESRVGSREVVAPDTDHMEDELSDEKHVNEQLEENDDGKTLERCKFWPSCKNKSCQFIHPTKPCRMFPNCSFKDKCIFFHPMCKYDTLCTKVLCPYTHSRKQGKKIPSGFQHDVQMEKDIPICVFHPNCSKSNCRFRHPASKPCRYGSGCNRSNCQYHHETRPATGDALKWTANLTNSPPHISDRTFAVTSDEAAAKPVSISTR